MAAVTTLEEGQRKACCALTLGGILGLMHHRLTFCRGVCVASTDQEPLRTVVQCMTHLYVLVPSQGWGCGKNSSGVCTVHAVAHSSESCAKV